MKAPWLLLLCALSGEAVATTGTTTPAAHEGHLVTRHGGDTVDVPLEHTDVKMRVDGFLADVTVTQRFHNPYKSKIEAVYLFPLPTTAAVSDMTIAIGNRTIRGSIHERARATAIYEAARTRGNVAALLTEQRANLFTQSVANLEPDARVDVTIHYVDRLAYDNGGYELTFPMVAGPRYLPDGAKDSAIQPQVLPAGMRSSHDISLSVELDAGVPVGDIRSPSHRLTIAKSGPARAHVAIEASDAIPNKDFILRYQVAGPQPSFAVLPYRDGDTGSFLLVAQPPALTQTTPITPRELVFVLDTSASMRGAPLAKAKQLIDSVLQTLRPDDTFQIVRFDDDASQLGPRPVANKPSNVKLVRDWLSRLDAWGGTEMVAGIDAALAVPHDPARLRIVAFITDGYVGNEDSIAKRVGDKLGESRVFCFGVGSAVNRYLLDEIAAMGRGSVQVVRPDEDSAAAVAAFRRRIDLPVLTDLAIDWHGLPVTDVTPGVLPDVFAGQPVVVSGHYTGSGHATIDVTGMLAGQRVSFPVDVTLPDREPARPAIATVWARQRIAELSRELIRKDDAAVTKAIIALSLEHHLITPYTAFVAVDDSRVTAGGKAERVVVPVEVPDVVAGFESLAGSGRAYGMSMGYGSIGSGRGGYAVGGGGGGFRTRSAAGPVVVLAQPVMVGDIDKSIIRRYIKRNLEKIRYCYEKALLGTPTLDGTLRTKFVINGHGLVVHSEATGLGDEAVATCVADVIKTIEFPSAPGGGAVEVNYPFTFHPNEIREPNR